MAFAGAKHFVVNELTQFDIQVRAEESKTGIDGFEYLRSAIAEGAFHNSAERLDPPNCHPETRKAIIKAIRTWVNNRKRTTGIMWLCGPAGAGKSAIAQRLAELCDNEKKLCASFFFSGTVAKRNTHTHLFATIVYQMVLAIPETKPFVVQAIEKDSTLFSRSLEVQIQLLIWDPLMRAMSASGGLSKKSPQLIIIDGLDECVSREGQIAILKAISGLLHQRRVPLCFLVASRPELSIRNTFELPSVKFLTTSLALDDSFNPDKDIEVFLRSCFIDIKQSHTMRPFSELWPSDDAIDTLVRRSSGQFIYASVVMKYISDHQDLPTKRLNVILGSVPCGDDTPYAPLDALYRCILSTVRDYTMASRVLGALLCLADGKRFTERPDNYNSTRLNSNVLKSPRFLDHFLSLQRGQTCVLLSDLHSVLSVPHNGVLNYHGRIIYLPIKFHHASFSEFLLDPSRSKNFAISPAQVHADLSKLSLLNWNHSRGVVRKYAIDCVFYHISKASQTPDLVNTLCSLYLSDRVSFNSLRLYIRSFEGNISQVLRQYEMVLSLKWMSTSDHPDIMLVYLALQHSLDLSHLVVLSKFSDHSLLPIFLLLSNLLGSIDRDIFHFCFDSASEKYAQTPEPFISDWLTVDEHTLGLLSKIPDEYRLWLFQFLLSPSRAKKYSLQEQHYKYVILVLLEILYCPPSRLKLSLRSKAKYVVLIERILPLLLPKTSPSQKVADALRNMASETPLSAPLKEEVQKYLRKCKSIIPWIDFPGVSTNHESLSKKLGRKLGVAILRAQRSHETLIGRSG